MILRGLGETEMVSGRDQFFGSAGLICPVPTAPYLVRLI